MNRGNFWGTVQNMDGCIYNNCLVWPREVGTPLAVNRCGHSIPPRNHWYSYNAVLPDDVRHFQHQTINGCRGDIALENIGVTPVFNQIPCLNDRFVRFYPTQPTDVGKTITIFGIDGNGQVIRSQRSDGTFQDGVVLVLAMPFVETTFLVRRIDRVLKQATDGPVFGYQWDGATLFDLAAYASSETNPEYRNTKILTGLCNSMTSGCCSPGRVRALVKLKFIPVVNDDDLVLIDNLDALAVAMQSIKQSDAYDSDEAEKMMARAVHELNLELRDRLPIDETPVNFKPYGNAHLRRQRIGHLM